MHVLRRRICGCFSPYLFILLLRALNVPAVIVTTFKLARKINNTDRRKYLEVHIISAYK